MNLWLLGGRIGEGTVREFGMDMYTLPILKWVRNKGLSMAQGTVLSVI